MLSLSIHEPALLARVTTQYDMEQDRMRLTGEARNTQVQELWLTQRLLLRLLPGLWQWLQALPDAGVDGVAADAAAAAYMADPQHREALQEFAQQQASASLARQAPVQARQFTLPWLVRSAQIQTSAALLHLHLFSSGDAARAREDGSRHAVIAMNPIQLRQWLGIVHREFTRAGWPTTPWPQWMRQPAEPTPEARLH